MSRRGLLTGGALAAGGALAGAAAVAAARAGRPGPVRGGRPGAGGAASAARSSRSTAPGRPGSPPSRRRTPRSSRSPCEPGTDRAALGRMLRLLTDDAARLTQGQPALADTEPELGLLPARLTVTFGFGPGLYTAAGSTTGGRRRSPTCRRSASTGSSRAGPVATCCCRSAPTTRSPSPTPSGCWSRTAGPSPRVRWVQQGFRRAAGVEPGGRTQRNLFGQLDGTANPRPGAPLDTAVWVPDGPAWLRDSTTLVRPPDQHEPGDLGPARPHRPGTRRRPAARHRRAADRHRRARRTRLRRHRRRTGSPSSRTSRTSPGPTSPTTG